LFLSQLDGPSPSLAARPRAVENVDGIGAVPLDELASDVLDHLLVVHLTAEHRKAGFDPRWHLHASASANRSNLHALLFICVRRNEHLDATIPVSRPAISAKIVRERCR